MARNRREDDSDRDGSGGDYLLSETVFINYYGLVMLALLMTSGTTPNVIKRIPCGSLC